MAKPLPLGVFSRGRRDMDVSGLAIGGVQNQTNQQSLTYLGNNSSTGEQLAVYGILAWRAAFPQLMQAWVIKGLQSGTNGDVMMLDGTVGQIPGTVITKGGAQVAVSHGLNFMADGRSWLTNGDVPLFLIQVGQSVQVTQSPQQGTLPTFESTYVTFLWGVYRVVRQPKRG